MSADDLQKKLEEGIARGNEARFIIENPIYAESMAKMKQQIVDLWAACPARDSAGREWLWNHYQAALKFEQSLQEVLNTGMLAIRERELSLAEKVGQKLRSVI